MAINPNTDFTAGAVLTADQQNRFPRGIVAYTQSTTATGTITAEVVTLTSSSFTAVANRYYKITYFEPLIQSSAPPPSYFTAAIRLTNISGARLQYSELEPVISTGGDGQLMMLQAIVTFSAGSTTVCGTLRAQSNSITAFANADVRRFILVEDIGPA
jgi:hypothetical protein